MRARHITVLALAGLAVLLPATAARAGAIRTTYSGTEACNVLIDPGVTTVLPNGSIHIRGLIVQCTEAASDPRAAGTNTVVVNANWDSNGLGPYWGIFDDANADGSWVGTWEGKVTPTGGAYRATGAGTGAYAGMRLFVQTEADTVSGMILDPGGK